MKKITYFLPIQVILIAGCAQQDIQTPEETSSEEQPVVDALVGTAWSGTIKGEAIYQRTVPKSSYAFTAKQVETGDFSFTIYKAGFKNRIKGSGTGKAIYTETGECEAESSLTTSLKIVGVVDELTGKIAINISDDVDNRSAWEHLTINCQSELRYKGRTQTTNGTFSAMFDLIYVDELEPASGASVEFTTPWVVAGSHMVYTITIYGDLPP